MNLATRARIGAGLSQAKLGELLGVHKTLISRWERDIYQPTGATRVLLRLILDDPGGMVERLEGLRAAEARAQAAEPEGPA